MQRDLKLYFEKTETIVEDLRTYLRAVTTMETALKNVASKLSNCEGKSINAILNTEKDLAKDIKKCKEEIQDLYDLFDGYNTDMQNIMWPKDKGSMMRVDRNDIWWNKNQINSEVEVVNSLRFLVAYNDQSYAYGVNELTADADDEEIQKQQRNGAKIDEIFNTVAPASYSTLKQYMTYIDNFHENKVIPFENKDDEYASKAGKLLKTYENCFEWFSRISAKIEKAKMDFYKSFFKALWDTVTGLVSLVGGLIKFSAATDVLVVCKLIDMSPPKWATNAYDKGIESAKMFVTLQWIPALGQQVMDSVEEDGIFSVAGYGIGSLVGIKGLDKVGKMAKIAVQGGKAARILETANCVDDIVKLGITSADDLARAGITSVDDLLKLGVNSMDDLSKLGINSVDDLAKLGITSEEDLARLGIKSGDEIVGGAKDSSAQHAVGNAKQAQSVLDGIDPKYFNTESRFGGGFYIGGDSETIVAELAEHGNVAKYAISYDMNLSGQKVLDLTNSQMAAEWGYVQNLTSTKACQKIGELARNQGYSVVKFQSYRGEGINYVIYDNFEEILSPRMVTPVD